MALKDRFRRAASRKNSSTPSSPNTSPNSSGFTTPSTLSRAPSTTQLPNLLPSPTGTSLKLAKTSTSSSTLTKTSSTTSKLSLSRFRSNSSKKENWAKYAPRNYKFGVANLEKVATLNAWEWSFGANPRASISSGISPSRSPSMDIPRAQHVENVAARA